MNEAMQRVVPAILLTFVLHGALLSWQIQQPQPLRTKPVPQKVTVNLKRLPPPLPPIKKIVQKARDLPELPGTERQPVRPVPPMPKKIVQKVPTLPKIARVQRRPVRPVPLKPGKKISSTPQALPKISRVARKAPQPLALKPVKKSEPKPVLQPVQPRPVLRQQPVRRSTRPVRRTRTVQQRVASAPVKTAKRAVQPVNAGVIREAAPLYKTNPPPKYPRMARRRGLEGVVTIEAKIDVNGKVTELRLFAGSGHKILDKAALKAVRRWKFSPGTVGGRSRSMWVKVPVRFELH